MNPSAAESKRQAPGASVFHAILLAQNRQDDRDRVAMEQDRQRAARNLADTEYMAREIVALRMTIDELRERQVTRDVLREELRVLLSELDEQATSDAAAATTDAKGDA